MDNQNVKRGRGRPPKYSTEEERKDAMRKNKTAYMLEKSGIAIFVIQVLITH